METFKTTITMTGQQKDWVNAQVEAGEFQNVSECVRECIRQSIRRKEADSKLSDESIQEFMDKHRATLEKLAL